MGELFGLPEWLAVTLFVVGGLAIWLIAGFIMHRRAMHRLAVKRPSPSEAEFLLLMSEGVDADIIKWFWKLLEPYYTPLTPHPDALLVKDACIDGDDIEMEWVSQFLDDFGLDKNAWPKRWPEWPDGVELTVRNFARFLQTGRHSLIKSGKCHT